MKMVIQKLFWRALLIVALTVVLATVFLISLNSPAVAKDITFPLSGREIIRMCPSTACRDIGFQYNEAGYFYPNYSGEITTVTTVKKREGNWYFVEVNRKAGVVYYDNSPIYFGDLVVNGWIHKDAVPQLAQEELGFFLETNQDVASSPAVQAQSTGMTEIGRKQVSLVNLSGMNAYIFFVILALVTIFAILKFKNHIGFVSRISRRSAFLVAATSLGILGIFVSVYFAVIQYNKYQERGAVIQRQQQALLEKTQQALEGTQKEIEALKKSEEKRKATTQEPATKLPTDVYPPIVKKWATGVVQLSCRRTENDDVQTGSGLLLYTPISNTYFVLTNYHVVAPQDSSEELCYVFVYPNSPLLTGKVIFQSVRGSFVRLTSHFSKEYLDIASFDIESIDESLGLTDNGLSVYRPLSFLRPLALDPAIFTYCSEAEIGDRLLIFGYPSVAGESLTVTEGIVAGIEVSGSTFYYKTSAKIEHGNSGGAAIHVGKNCLLGIPTLAAVGEIESIAFILPIQ